MGHKMMILFKYKKVALILISAVFLCFAGCKPTTLPLTDEDYASVTDQAPEIDLEAPGISNSNTNQDTVQSIAQMTNNDKEETSSATIAEEASFDSQISIIMVGDILLHTPIENYSLQSDGSYDFSTIFEHTKDLISEADIAIVNEEVIIGGEELGISGYPAFNAPYEVSDALVDAGFDVVCHATNHALDKGKKGILNCLNHWQEAYPDIAILGIHDSAKDQSKIYYCEQNGIKIAILNFTYGTNGIALPADMPFAVDLLEQEKIRPLLQEARENADYVIVCPHWGTEYRLSPDDSQKKWTKFFLENQVDLVLGTHPHVIEPIDLLTDEATGHEMLVYYSLGNYVNWTSGTGSGVSNRMVGGMATVTIKKSETDIVSLFDYDIIPLVCHVTEETNGITVYPLSEYSEELAMENKIISQAPDFSYQYCNDLCDEIWGEYR